MEPTLAMTDLDLMGAGTTEVARASSGLEPWQGAVERPSRLPAVPWRDPHTVDRDELRSHIAVLEKQALEQPQNSDLRVCLGMAYAMDFNVYKSMDRLEEARALDPESFFAQMKYAELLYRLRALDRAERETATAIRMAGNTWELSMARKQIADIRRMRREGLLKPEWTKSLPASTAYVAAGLAICAILLYIR
jgi:hypothetical protein